jgi:hypothetical protein
MHYLLSILFIAVIALFLLRGGPTRIAAFDGWLVGIAAGVLAWRLG